MGERGLQLHPLLGGVLRRRERARGPQFATRDATKHLSVIWRTTVPPPPKSAKLFRRPTQPVVAPTASCWAAFEYVSIRLTLLPAGERAFGRDQIATRDGPTTPLRWASRRPRTAITLAATSPAAGTPFAPPGARLGRVFHAPRAGRRFWLAASPATVRQPCLGAQPGLPPAAAPPRTRQAGKADVLTLLDAAGLDHRGIVRSSCTAAGDDPRPPGAGLGEQPFGRQPPWRAKARCKNGIPTDQNYTQRTTPQNGKKRV